MLTVGTKAPDFTLNDTQGDPVSLSDFLGRKVVLYFYARDTPPAVPVRPAPLHSITRHSPRRMWWS